MRFAAFVAPWLLDATVRFIDSAARLAGVRLALITCEPRERLPPRLRESLAMHWRVDDAMDPQQIVDAARGLAAHAGRPVERLIAILEQLQVPVAEAREFLGLPGLDAATALNFRDKHRMKDVLRAAGVPVARHAVVVAPAQALAFAAEVGFPLVVKPPAGAGAVDTFRLDDAAALRGWLAATPPSPADPRLLEEFLLGDEFTYDSVTIGGEVVWHSIACYRPTPLEALRSPWIQWVVLLPRAVDGGEFADIRRVGPAALRALGLRHGLSHMEWFRRADGGVAVSEVGARPPGAGITSALGFAHDIDLYAEWPRLMLLDRFTPPPRRWAVGVAYLRGQGHGKIRGLRGVDELRRELGQLVVEVRLPQIGATPTGSYSGDGLLIVRHPDTAVVTAALHEVVTRLKVDVA
ncbi:MAG: hypothetical protein JNL82_06780 [Myxococcales bacterium]|nr:hypothetical protein [Myxococcales bacterium]